jgi:hypothetical protein
MMSLIQAIKEGNQFQSLKQKPDRLEIQRNLKATIDNILGDPDFKIQFQSYFSNEFLNHWLSQLIPSFFSDPISAGLTLGSVALFAEGPFRILATLEALIPLLTYQNVVLLFVKEKNEPDHRVWDFIKNNLPNPNQLQILSYSEDLWKFAIQHPGVKSIYWHSPHQAHQSIPSELAPFLIEKSFYFTKTTKNTFCVLDGANLKEAATDLISRLHEGRGLAPFSVSRILVQQKVETEFLNIFRDVLQSEQFSRISSNTQDLTPDEYPQYKLQDFLKEQGRILIQQDPVTILSNISNCFEWHQIPLNQSTAFWMDIKYPFEIAKWINNISHHNYTTIWMDKSKNRDWAFEINSHVIEFNTPLKMQKPQSFWTGVKMEFYKPRAFLNI